MENMATSHERLLSISCAKPANHGKQTLLATPSPHDITWGCSGSSSSPSRRHRISHMDGSSEMVLHHSSTQCMSTVRDFRSFMVNHLLQAVFFNRMPLARRLISDWGADQLRQNEDGETILSLAISLNNSHVVKYLLALPGASKLIENRNFLGDGPIHLAAVEGNRRIIRMLLAAGASPTSRGFEDRNALHLCASLVNKRAFCTFFDHIEQSSPSALREMINH